MKYIITAVVMFVCIFAGQQVRAEGAATPKEVYDLVLKAYSVVETLGEESFAAFNDPEGEFVYKDTYVVVGQCPGKTLTHPFVLDKLKDVDMDAKYPWFKLMCQATASPNGKWVEYQWPKPGATEPSRKLSFVIGVGGTPYMLIAGIYSEDASLADLNEGL